MRWIDGAAAFLMLLVSACASAPPGSGPMAERAASAAQTAPRQENRVPVILISLDGFRNDYLDRGLTPNLAALIQSGSRAERLVPSFPSLTFPNHYTMVTGRVPGEHGIVNNVMEDPGIPGVTFRPGNADAVTDGRWWSDAEPIWVTAERKGIRTATMFWPGSEAVIDGIRPSEWVKFDNNLSSTARVDQVLSWLDRPFAERPGFISLYLQETDDTGHRKGPESPEIDTAIRATDAAIGRLTAALRTRGIDANLIVASDHGMARVTHLIRLDQRADVADFRLVTSGAIAGIEPRPGREEQLAKALLRPHNDMQCWKKGALPPAFSYNQHRRIAPIICLAGAGGMIVATEPQSLPAGMHGYGPGNAEMDGILIVNGPAFSSETAAGVRAMTDVYPLMRSALGF